MIDSAPDLESLPVVEVPVRSLSAGRSPRTGGHDEEVVRLLAESDRPWPPLLVRRETYQVIDGAHRLLAAQLRGDETIEVRLHDCDEADAFVLAVRANIAHGLPLSLRDRKAAAARIIESRPAWSNRRIALATGLSDKTVAVIRREGPPGAAGPEGGRVGMDGRLRPVDIASRRAMASRLLEQNPGASLREIAALAGVSPETVRSVRGKGVRPMPRRVAQAPAQASTQASTQAPTRAPAQGAPGPDARRYLRLLLQDPALRSTDAGRLLLRVLSEQALLDRNLAGLVEIVPEHDLLALQELAMASAAMWRSLAQLASGRGVVAPGAGDRLQPVA